MKTVLTTVTLVGLSASAALAAERIAPPPNPTEPQLTTGPVKLTDAQLEEVVGGVGVGINVSDIKVDADLTKNSVNLHLADHVVDAEVGGSLPIELPLD